MKPSGSIPLFLLLAAASAATLPAADWPRFGGPGASFVSPETGLARSWPAGGPRVAWNVPVGKGFGGAAISQGQVFILDRAEPGSDVIRCLSLENGRELWKRAYDAPGTLPYDGSRNVPTVGSNRVFTIGPFGQLTCADRNTGAIQWSKHLVADFRDPAVDRPEKPATRAEELERTQLPRWGMAQAPLLYDGLVITAPQTRKTGLAAFDQATGALRWQSPYLGRSWYSYVSPCLARFQGVDQVLMLGQPSDPEKSPKDAPPALITSVDAATGRILWSTQTPAPYKLPISQPLPVGNDRLFITGGYNLGALMFEVTFTNGAWATRLLFRERSAAAHIQSPVLFQDRIYVSSFKEHGATNAGLVCLDLQGRPLWQTAPKFHPHDGGFLFAGGLILAIDGRNGELNLLAPGPASCDILASAPVLDGPNVWAPLAFSQGRLVVRDQHQMKCLDLRAAAVTPQ